jgi:hypothetical protein
MGVSQKLHAEALLSANDAVIRRIRETVSDVTPADMQRQPPMGGWSIGEVLEHLIISADSYLVPLRALIQKGSGHGADASAMWKPTIMGGLLASSLRNPRKLPAPGGYKPGPDPRPHVLEEFLRRQEEVGRLITQAGGMDWRHARINSPVVPILRFNLGDALTVLVVHAERHAQQIERVKAAHSAVGQA